MSWNILKFQWGFIELHDFNFQLIDFQKYLKHKCVVTQSSLLLQLFIKY